MTDSARHSHDAAAEAARYALLRRLAPAMRHHLVVHLQPIGMVYEIMDRRLRAPEPNLADVQEGARKISGYARNALASCVDVVTWLAPDDAARCTATDGIAECLALVATGFNFRGFSLADAGDHAPGDVRRATFRNVVTGALLHLSDAHSPPADIGIRTQAEAGGLVVMLTVTPKAGEAGFSTAPAYRPLGWDDVCALAAADGAQVRREDAGLRITLPWSAPSPS